MRSQILKGPWKQLDENYRKRAIAASEIGLFVGVLVIGSNKATESFVAGEPRLCYHNHHAIRSTAWA